MIELNVMALTALTRLALPGMLQRRRGRVLNVASVAGFVPGPLQAVYFATKAYVVSFSQALASELSEPALRSPRSARAPRRRNSRKPATWREPRRSANAATAGSVASYGYEAMLRGRTVAIPGLRNRVLLQLTRALPRWAITRISRSLIEKR